jgi:predicted KAP-like P-loop ATPase
MLDEEEDDEAMREAAKFLESAPVRNHLAVCQYISMCQKLNENHYQSHRDKLYYVADQTKRLEKQQALAEQQAEKQLADFPETEEILDLENYLKHLNPNSEDYLILMELIA